MTAKTSDLEVGGFRRTLPALESGPDDVVNVGDVIAQRDGKNWTIIHLDEGSGIESGILSDWVGEAHIIHRAPRLREVPFTLPTGQSAVLIGEDRDIEPGEEFIAIVGAGDDAQIVTGENRNHTPVGDYRDNRRVPKAGARIEVRP